MIIGNTDMIPNTVLIRPIVELKLETETNYADEFHCFNQTNSGIETYIAFL